MAKCTSYCPFNEREGTPVLGATSTDILSLEINGRIVQDDPSAFGRSRGLISLAVEVLPYRANSLHNTCVYPYDCVALVWEGKCANKGKTTVVKVQV